MGLAAQLSRRPGDAFAVIPVRRGDEHHLLNGIPIRRRFQVRKADVLRVKPKLAADHSGERIEAAQALERVQAESPGLVFHKERLYAQILRHGIQLSERRLAIGRVSPVDPVGRGNRRFRQKLRSFSLRSGSVRYHGNAACSVFFHCAPRSLNSFTLIVPCQTGINLSVSPAATFRKDIFRLKIHTVQKQWTAS